MFIVSVVTKDLFVYMLKVHLTLDTATSILSQ